MSPPGEESHSEKEEEQGLQIIFMVFLAMLIFYTVVGLYMEKVKPPIGHETGVIVLLGMSISFVIQAVNEEAVEML